MILSVLADPERHTPATDSRLGRDTSFIMMQVPSCWPSGRRWPAPRGSCWSASTRAQPCTRRGCAALAPRPPEAAKGAHAAVDLPCILTPTLARNACTRSPVQPAASCLVLSHVGKYKLYPCLLPCPSMMSVASMNDSWHMPCVWTDLRRAALQADARVSGPSPRAPHVRFRPLAQVPQLHHLQVHGPPSEAQAKFCGVDD